MKSLLGKKPGMDVLTLTYAFFAKLLKVGEIDHGLNRESLTA